MDRLFLVVVLYVTEDPYVSGILTVWIARQLTFVVATPRLLVLILLRHANGIKVERIVIRFREPENGFVPSGELISGVEAVLSYPRDPVSGQQSEPLKDGEESDIKRDESSLICVGTN